MLKAIIEKSLDHIKWRKEHVFFVESTKIKWTASTTEGNIFFPYMRGNETGDMFIIDWTYNGYSFAIYGKSP